MVHSRWEMEKDQEKEIGLGVSYQWLEGGNGVVHRGGGGVTEQS
jgi:hypothetical protein